MLTQLHSLGLNCAPHVLSRVISGVDGDQPSVIEMVAGLDPAVRAGLRPLPHPLPLVPAVASRFEGLEFGTRDRDLLLGVALTLDDELDPLLVFDGRTAEQIANSAAGEHLVIRAGRVRFADPRLGLWVEGTASTSVESSAHRRLAQVFDAIGDRVGADWHRARASMRGLAEAAPELIRIARSLSESGHTDRALQLAAEAAAHATDADLDEARLVAGAASIGAGYAAEAASWLSALFPRGTEKYRLQGLSGLLIAQAHLHGVVPDVDPSALRPTSDDLSDWYSWTRAAAFGAVLSAERHDRQGMRLWLDALREGSIRTGTEGSLRDPVVALSWLIARDDDREDVSGHGPFSGQLLRALRAAIDGDLDRALRAITASDSDLTPEVDAFVEGFEHSPLVHAYLAVIEALLLAWRGDIRASRDRLNDAALDLPVAMAFSGMGVALLRRLDLAVDGAIGPVAQALTNALPAGFRLDRLVDRAIESFLSGSFDDATAIMRLWLDQGAPGTAFALPGFDEAAPWSWEHPTIMRLVEPPQSVAARGLRAKVATLDEGRWRAESEAILAAAREVLSPFERGRLEAMIGIRSSIGQEAEVAREHLRAAQNLFAVAGADAWTRVVSERIDRLDADASGGQGSRDDLSACRAAWEPLLTSRELEIAMRVAAGASNRTIAEELNVSVRTVEVHLGRVFTKLDVRTRGELTVRAHRVSRYV